jgi:hypothetical protein
MTKLSSDYETPAHSRLDSSLNRPFVASRLLTADTLARAVVFVALATMLGVTVWAFQRELALTTCSSVVVRDTHYIICTRPSPEAAR